MEQERINWDSTIYKPLSLRVGIGRSAGAAATVLTDEVRLTESGPS